MSVDPDQILSKKLQETLILAELYIDKYIENNINQLMRNGFVRIGEEELIRHTLGTYNSRFPVLIREHLVDEIGKLYPGWVIKEKMSPTYEGTGSTKYVLEFTPRKKLKKLLHQRLKQMKK